MSVNKDHPLRNKAGVVRGLLWFYKHSLSPVFYFFGARCRHYPTCSEYMAQAFERHRFWRAFWLSVSRVSRCHPWGSHGIDQVPTGGVNAGWRIWRLGDWEWTERSETKPDV